MDDRGRIVSIGTLDRVFNHHQRKAITLRDGGCIIPGCHIPAAWCEIHHVTDHALGGPTHTDNGVLLCWHHHRTL
ncbi:HNH endonuclease signature motif containing protein, partial [Micromonospora sp. DT81.3]|uniref:HNH endonuclease signature motif containing protein n=1 Tax=Micromonospora sp. DT81.3 TaxID=3416523 RepID=UPI003CF3EF71